MMKKQIASTKNFVQNHRVAITFAATSAVWMAVMVRTAREFNNFLEEHDLLEEYYQEGMLEELTK